MISNEFKVGLLTLVTGASLYFGFNYLKGVDLFSPTHTYFATYKNLDGLTVSNAVKINGFNVGRVSEIRVLQERGNLMLIGIEVDDKLQLTDSTIAVLANDGLLGGKYIELKVRRGGRNIAHLDTSRVNDLLLEYKGLSTNVKQVMSNVEQLTANSNKVVVDNQAKISQIMGNVQALSASLVETEKSLKPLIGKFNTLADSLNAAKLATTVSNANRSITEINKALVALNKAQGTAGKLIYNDSIYNNLNKVLADLDNVLLDFKANPRRYIGVSVFGGKDKSGK
jgi:phospholipid/cholesterol/gamma-HCH transport system substrate-binding protein